MPYVKAIFLALFVAVFRSLLCHSTHFCTIMWLGRWEPPMLGKFLAFLCVVWTIRKLKTCSCVCGWSRLSWAGLALRVVGALNLRVGLLVSWPYSDWPDQSSPALGCRKRTFGVLGLWSWWILRILCLCINYYSPTLQMLSIFLVHWHCDFFDIYKQMAVKPDLPGENCC